MFNRPFERTITLQKDSAGTVGFVFKDNKITAIVKDSSAARNGLLIEHHMVEVNGQNVIGLKVLAHAPLLRHVIYEWSIASCRLLPICSTFTKSVHGVSHCVKKKVVLKPG